MSGVNWILLNSPPMAPAKVFASRVFAVPACPSIRTCPSLNKPMSRISLLSVLPTTIFEISSIILVVVSVGFWGFMFFLSSRIGLKIMLIL